MTTLNQPIYIGFDFSTQQVTAVVIDYKLQSVCESSVTFDEELPEFRTQGGVRRGDHGCTVTAPSIMWVKALELLIDKLKVAGVEMSRVAGICGVAQQHGSVYWREGAERTLTNLSADQFMYVQLDSCFTVRDSPVWQDSSTTEECRALERYLGGSKELFAITGSTAYERFTGCQIAKIYRNSPEIYKNTERISLVSSFAASLFLCRYASIDLSDGSGMNLLDISSGQWNQHCLDACAPGLHVRLGEPVPAGMHLGPVGAYWRLRHDFTAPNCCVSAFTGDNCGSLIALAPLQSDLIVSLGTSDTIVAPSIIHWSRDISDSQLSGHVMVSPLRPGNYMALLCFKNGSLMREKLRDSLANGSWELFGEMLESCPAGNQGQLGIYWDESEITPSGQGRYRCVVTDDPENLERSPSSFQPCSEIRALIESQMMSKRLHVQRLGFSIDEKTRILATGGASINRSILQVLSDVFNSPVYTHTVTNATCLGAAYMAKIGSDSYIDSKNPDNSESRNRGVVHDAATRGREESLFDLLPTDELHSQLHLVCHPRPQAAQVYETLLKKYAVFEADVSTQRR